LSEDGPSLIDRDSIRRGASGGVGALTIAALQQVGWRFPHLHKPEDQSHDDDDAAELTDPATGFPGRDFVHRFTRELANSDRRQKRRLTLRRRIDVERVAVDIHIDRVQVVLQNEFSGNSLTVRLPVGLHVALLYNQPRRSGFH
jgi:hypothetical protein